jgi:Tfp pilus assembly protein PilN
VKGLPMLRTNLSTRPFYNERVTYLLLGLAGVLVLAFTVFNIVELRSLTVRHRQLLGRVVDEERRAATLRADAEQARSSVNRAQLETVAEAAREANGLIDQRTFSWTELLNRLEATLPPDVRIQSIRPSIDRDGVLTVALLALAHRVEDVEQFVEQMEKTGTFHHLISRSETTNAQGLLEVALEGQYLPGNGAHAPTGRTPGRGAAQQAPED